MHSLSESIIQKAKENNYTIATAESITGGRIASNLTAISGSSTVFTAGVVCYSEHSKIHSAGVDVRLINEKGVYCTEVVEQMAERIAKRNIADIGIATSGCAEEGDGTCPKGNVYFAFAQRGKETITEKKAFEGSRQEIQDKATEHVLSNLLQMVS